MCKHRLPPLAVLVVEDLPDAASSTVELLGLYGFTARAAACGEEALAVIAADPPDVILLDIHLPDLDGWEVARRVRQRTAGKQPVVVAVTGYAMSADHLRSADAGIDLHLVKPVEPAVLVAHLERFRAACASHQEDGDGCMPHHVRTE